MYKYYQKVGGTEPWELVQDDANLDEVKPTFITVLALDTIFSDDMGREEMEKTRYMGPMYFDLDDEHDVTNSIAGGVELIGKLQDYGLEDTDIQIFLSGKKGIHVLVPQAVFMDRVSPLPKLPAIYKELAYNLAVDTLDFKVYTARRGRMLRTCHNVRENGAYRVPVTVAELKSLTADGYRGYCSSPRNATPLAPKYRAKFALVFDQARQKISKLKPRKSKPVDAATLKRHEPIVKRVMEGACIDGVGFNKIAIQLALYARSAGITPDELVRDSNGLLESHKSDGSRYNTKFKREQEIRRMCAYVDDNPTYEYSIDPIKALLPKDEAQEAEDAGEQIGGVILREGGYYLVGSGDTEPKILLDAEFQDIKVLHDVNQGAIACLVGNIAVPGKAPKKVSMERADFVSSTSLHKLTSAYGVSFMGTDINARGIYELMLRNIQPNKYVTECEGLDLIKIPASPFEEARKPFLIWADNKGVRLPKHIADLGIEIEFQGWPDPEGAIKTDLTEAPPLKPWVAEPYNKNKLTHALVNLFKCQEADVLAKMLGWMIASFWRQLFHEVYGKYPLLHVNGVAGAGKTELTTSLLSMFYYQQEPKVITPSSTVFSVQATIAGSASVPVVVDEYKPQEMTKEQHNRLKLLFRDAYNRREITRGGGNRTKDSFGALSTTMLSAPIAFIAEAMESETALLERVVLVTIKRQPTMVAARNYKFFKEYYDNRHVLSILGANIAAYVARHGSVESLKTEFDAIYNAARMEYMPQAGDADTLTEEQIAKKQGAKERVVYNTSVAAFGLSKFIGLLKGIYGDEYPDLFGVKMAELEGKVFARMDDSSKSTHPEYLKVLIAMSDMTRLPPENQYSLVNGVEYALSEEGGLATLHIIPRLAYAKYRAWTRYQNLSPLFNDDKAFAHSLNDAPQFFRHGRGTKTINNETTVFDYNLLIRSGMPDWVGKMLSLDNSQKK